MPTYVLPDLPFDHAALEPWCSAEVLELHHGKHHKAYVDGANAAVDALAGTDAADKQQAMHLAGVQESLVFNLSGHMLHSLFWKSICPDRQQPEGELRAAIEDEFGSIPGALSLLRATANGVRGSGWGALAWEPLGQRLLVMPIHDHQDKVPPLAGLLAVVDVWEHAYYLQYRNERPKWVEQATEHLAWSAIASRFATIRQAPLIVDAEHATV